MKNFRYGLWAFALLMALWWVIDPTGIRKKVNKTDPELRVIPSKMGEVATEVDKKSAGELTTKEKAKASFDGSIDTGSGDEIAGEKILRFKDSAAYRRFLKMAPAGVVLDQIDQLQAVRVKDGEWLKSMGKSAEMEVGKNYYMGIPEVPAEVMTMGDSVYRVVGRDALKMMGADGV
ncbi:MAG: hypothetical protein EBY81_08300, partial [Verrucomicrobia bacterium]|nr:hypothetical protein [Verrucomicrobiota bacterium]